MVFGRLFPDVEISQTQDAQEVICNRVLHVKVFAELWVILNDFVPGSLQVVEEGTGLVLGGEGFTEGVGQKVGTVLARPEGALQHELTQTEAIQDLEGL